MAPVFQLVLFDIDGTLIDSGDVWVPAVQRAMREVYAKRQVDLPVPGLAELEKVIGIPGHEALHPFIPPEHRALIPEISRLVGEYGPATMRGGAGRVIPGVRETLEELRHRGSFLALASNCGNSYIREVSETMGIGDLVDHAFCLETPGVRHKTDMIAVAMKIFGTRRALMVGDRSLDLQAAHANGIPFLAYSGGFGEQAEWEEHAEGVIHSYQEFFSAIEGRQRFVEEIAEELAIRGAGQSVAITGMPLSGKSHFSEEIAERLREKKIPTRLHTMDEFPDAAKAKEALQPARSGEIVLCEGEGLGERNAAKLFHRILHLEVAEPIALRRFSGRAGAANDADRGRLAERMERSQTHVSGASIRIENSNVLAPKRIS